MRLSARRSLAVLAGVLLVFVLVGLAVYGSSIQRLRELELTRVKERVGKQVEHFEELGDIARGQVRAISETMAVRSLITAPDRRERARLESDLLAVMRAFPVIQQLRLIRRDDEGTEFVRVDRGDYNEPPRIVADSELQSKGHRDYYRDALLLEPGEVMLSPIELNHEHGGIEIPHRPVLRATIPIADETGRAAAFVVANLDLRMDLRRLQLNSGGGMALFMVDLRGQFLSHPDRNREFGGDGDSGFEVTNEFPQWHDWMRQPGGVEQLLSDEEDGVIGVVALPIVVAGNHRANELAYLVARVPDTLLRGMERSLVMIALVLGAVVALGLVVMVVAMWRELIRPLDTIMGGVAAYAGNGVLKLPVSPRSEFAPLSRAIERMTASIDEQTSALHDEIDERRRAQDALANIVAVLPDALLVVDAHDRVSFANKQVCALLELDVAEVIGDEPPIRHAIGQVTEARFERGGKVIQLETRAVAMTWMGEPGKLLVVRDVTELRELSTQLRQSQKMQAVGQLASGIAHDFNNLLAVVTMSADLLKGGNHIPDEEGRQLLEDLTEATRRARGVTAQLLAFSHKSALSRVRLNLSEVVSDLMKMLTRLLGADISIQESFTTNSPPILADAVQIEQVVLNLALNARDAMPNGGQLVVEVRDVVFLQAFDDGNFTAPAGNYAMLMVADSGQGMDRAARDRIFEPFYTTKTSGHGTGMGLANVYAIVQQAGGVISVESELGHGTTFKIYFPQVERDEAGENQPVPALLEAKGPARVLVVEDEKAIRRLVRIALENAGYTVTDAGNGDEALKLIEADAAAFDLVITDMKMPVLGGAALRDSVRRIQPDMRFIYMSGYFGESWGEATGTTNSASPFLSKPFSTRVLVQTVHAALS